jgi:hypothetical protein
MTFGWAVLRESSPVRTRRSPGNAQRPTDLTGIGLQLAALKFLWGHATLVTALILYEREVISGDLPVRFHTRSGVLTATRLPTVPSRWIFRLRLPRLASCRRSCLLGINPVWVGRNLDYVIEVESEDVLRSLNPDYVGGYRDSRVCDHVLRGCARRQRFLHFFGRRVGIPEDPEDMVNRPWRVWTLLASYVQRRPYDIRCVPGLRPGAAS